MKKKNINLFLRKLEIARILINNGTDYPLQFLMVLTDVYIFIFSVTVFYIEDVNEKIELNKKKKYVKC